MARSYWRWYRVRTPDSPNKPRCGGPPSCLHFLPPPDIFSCGRNQPPYLCRPLPGASEQNLDMGSLGFTSFSNFRRFAALPVSESEDVSIRSLRRAGRRFSALLPVFPLVRSAFPPGLCEFLIRCFRWELVSGNSSLEGRFGSPSAASGGFSFGSSAFAASWKRCWYLLPC